MTVKADAIGVRATQTLSPALSRLRKANGEIKPLSFELSTANAIEHQIELRGRVLRDIAILQEGLRSLMDDQECAVTYARRPRLPRRRAGARRAGLRRV